MEPNLAERLGGCSFELEICYLPSMGILSKSSHNNSTKTANVSTPTKSILKNGTLNFATPTNSPITTKSTKNCGGATASGCCREDFPVPTVVVPFASVGIRRKRLKGDSWCYKKVCEEVLALTAADFKQIIESAV